MKPKEGNIPSRLKREKYLRIAIRSNRQFWNDILASALLITNFQFLLSSSRRHSCTIVDWADQV